MTILASTDTLNKKMRKMSDIANALTLSAKNTLWKKFFSTEFPDARTCIKTMPAHTQTTISIMAYYLALHPGSTQKQRQWKNAAAGYALARSNPRWKVFFDTEFTTVRTCLNALPACTQKHGTIISYYLALHPDIALVTHREWEFQACSQDLYQSTPEWKNFFDTNYIQPLDCLAAMPPHTQSSVTIMAYYLFFHPQLIAKRVWSAAGSAAALSQQNTLWQNFFEKKYVTPQACLAAAPTHIQTAVTIVNYYLSLHPEITQARKWAEYASSITLAAENKDWKLFLEKQFTSPKDCILHMPYTGLSTATNMNYYLACQSQDKSNSHWRDFACALVFFKKYPEIFEALSADKATLESIKDAYQNAIPSLKSLRAYWQLTRTYVCDNAFIKYYTRNTTFRSVRPQS